MEISQNSNQESNVTKLRNITQLVSRIKFNKMAKYRKVGIKNQINKVAKYQKKSKLNNIENVTKASNLTQSNELL